MNSEPSLCTFGAQVLQKHLAALRNEVDGVREAEDIEAIHKMRVASRRLRAALPLFSDCFSKKEVKTWLKQLRSLTRALGAARDSDVQIELIEKFQKENNAPRLSPGLRRLRLRLVQQRTRSQKDVDAALDRVEKKKFYDLMEARLEEIAGNEPASPPFPSPLYQRSAAVSLELLDAFLAYEADITNPENSTQLHAMRIAAKKLRYTLETFTPLYPEAIQPFLQAVKQSQELLGEIHDCDVWTMMLPEFIQADHERTLEYYGHSRPMHPLLPGLHFFAENRIRERTCQYDEFMEAWQRWKNEELWNRLRGLLTGPLLEEVYPPAPGSTEPSTE